MSKPQTGEAQEGWDGNERVYKRENSLYVDVKDNKVVKARDLIEAILDVCGQKSLFACVPRSGNLYEVTMCDKMVTNWLVDGITCKGITYPCTPVVNDKLLVSFLDLPTYMPNKEIETKLEILGVDIVSPINRKCYSGTEVEDGTRMCTVKLPDELRSLPYVMKFSDGQQTANYRVVHDNQMKMCHNCFSLTHLYRDCPDVECFRCKETGHFKWQCKAVRCGHCFKFKCACRQGESDINKDRNSDWKRERKRGNANAGDENGTDVDGDNSDDEAAADDDVDNVVDDVEVVDDGDEHVIDDVNGENEDGDGDTIGDSDHSEEVEKVEGEKSERSDDDTLSLEGGHDHEISETLFGDVIDIRSNTAPEVTHETLVTPGDSDGSSQVDKHAEVDVEMKSPTLQRKRTLSRENDSNGESKPNKQRNKNNKNK